jgi:hypothetical protein
VRVRAKNGIDSVCKWSNQALANVAHHHGADAGVQVVRGQAQQRHDDSGHAQEHEDLDHDLEVVVVEALVDEVLGREREREVEQRFDEQDRPEQQNRTAVGPGEGTEKAQDSPQVARVDLFALPVGLLGRWVRGRRWLGHGIRRWPIARCGAPFLVGCVPTIHKRTREAVRVCRVCLAAALATCGFV